jgi:outer membrane protein assembly factor BamB
VTATPLHLGGDRWAVVDHRGRVHALTLKQEKDRWTIRVAWTTQAGKDALWSPPARSADGRVLWVGSDDDHVYRIDAQTGAILGLTKPFSCTPRKTTDPEAARCDQDTTPLPTDDGGVVTGGAGVARLDAAGALLWSHPVASHLRGAVARDAAGGLFAVTLGGEVLALTADGKLRWKARARGACDATPVLTGGCTLLVGCDDRTLTAHSTLDGHAKWRLHAPEGFRGGGALAPDGATVYWGNLDRHVYAVDTATGKVRWRYRTAGRHLIPPLVDVDGRVLAFPEERQLYLLAPDGGLVGTFTLPAIADAHPARVDDRTLLFPLETGELWLLAGD